MAQKTHCPVSRAEFAAHAKMIDGGVAGAPIVLEPKEFSTGSLGWHANPKIMVEIGGQRVQVQANILLTLVGSKDLPK